MKRVIGESSAVGTQGPEKERNAKQSKLEKGEMFPLLYSTPIMNQVSAFAPYTYSSVEEFERTDNEVELLGLTQQTLYREKMEQARVLYCFQ